ncbi:hypothetical protein EMIT0P265_100056 [Pseudomonas zeae]
MVEQLAFNQLVVGSNPTRPTIFETSLRWDRILRSEAKSADRRRRSLKGRLFFTGV